MTSQIVGGTSMTDWGVHIDGGAALLNMMRKNLQPEEPGVRLLLQFCLSAVGIEYARISKANETNCMEIVCEVH